MKAEDTLIDFELQVMQLLRTKFRNVQAHLASTLQCANLTPTQYTILEALYTQDNMSIGDVMNKVYSTKGNMTVVIKNMLDRGWIHRCESENDKRKSVIWLSEDGIKLVESYIPIYKEAVSSIFKSFTLNELEILNSLLNKIETKEG